MSSTRPSAKRQLIFRWGVVVVALAVLAAGCSQSEDGVSDGAEPAISTSPAGLGSAAPPAAEGTTTTQASVEEEPSGSGSEIASTTTSLSPVVVEGSLSDEAIRLIDVGVDACGDLLELRCAGAVRDICFQLRSDSGSQQSVRGSGGDVILAEDEQSDICSMYGNVHLWEVDAVLSAKYGDEYYRWNPGFLAFRDEFHSGARGFLASNPDLFSQTGGNYNWKIYSYKNVEDIGSFDEFANSSSWGEYLPEAVRLKLLRIFYDFGLASQFELDNLSVKSEEVANRILGAPDFPEAHRGCWNWNVKSLADMLTSEPTRRSTLDLEVFICIETLCANREAGDAVVCYFEDSDIDEFSNGRTILRGRSATISGFLWNSIKYFCAKGEEGDNAFPDDACHRVAAKICQIISRLALSKAGGSTEYLNLRISSRVERSACGLGLAWHYQTFNSARAGCYREIENLLTTMDLLSAQDSSCNDASEEYVEFWEFWRGREYVRIYYPTYWNELFRQYYAFEVFWQKIPLICSKNGISSSAFSDSECYNSIHRFCGSRYGTVDKNGIYAGDHLGRHYENLMRGGKKIQEALCGKILDARTQVSLESNSRRAYLNLKSHKSQKQLISFPNYYPLAITRKKELAVQFTENNIANITSAAERCTDNSFALSETECVTELWKSCFDLLSYRISSQKQYFYEYYHVSGSQEFWNSITYVCNAAWIAELARMASALSSSFPEDYQAGNFNQFLQHIADEAVDTGEGIITIDESGTARPNLNQEDLSPEVAETLTALGNSIAQLVQPYLRLPTVTQQNDV